MTTVTEPFGYFRSTPFGWEDCAETDEGAKALYEITPEQALEAMGWFSRLEIAQNRIVELENVRAGLIAALSGLLDVVQSNYVPNSGHAQDQARAALDAAQPKAPRTSTRHSELDDADLKQRMEALKEIQAECCKAMDKINKERKRRQRAYRFGEKRNGHDDLRSKE